jgi:hypothetical protein
MLLARFGEGWNFHTNTERRSNRNQSLLARFGERQIRIVTETKLGSTGSFRTIHALRFLPTRMPNAGV